MTQRTRYFLIGSAVVIDRRARRPAWWPTTTATCRWRRRRRDPPSWPTCRPSTTAVAYANVRTDHELGVPAEAAPGAADRRGQGQASSGDSASTSSRTSTRSSAGFTGGDPIDKGSGAVVARARPVQRRRRSKPSATQHGATVEDYKGKRMLIMPAPAAEGQPARRSSIAGGRRVPRARPARARRCGRRAGARSTPAASADRHHQERRADEARERRATARATRGSSGRLDDDARSTPACPSEVKDQLCRPCSGSP